MGRKPDINTEEFIKGYRFVRLPPAWAGEAFTKGYLEVYMLMRSKVDDKMRLYRTSYKIPITSDFLKYAYDGVALKGRYFHVYDIKKLSSYMVEYDHKNKTVDTDVVEEFDADFEVVMEEIMKLQNEAQERGWTVC